MTRRSALWRRLGQINADGQHVGLEGDELAVIFTQFGLDHAVSVWGVADAASWLRDWADSLEQGPRKFRGHGYAWLDR